jgi:hypothetical protein
VKISITQSPTVRVQCECGQEGLVADLEAAVVWAFHEGLRHGKGTRIDVIVDLTLHVINQSSDTSAKRGLGII